MRVLVMFDLPVETAAQRKEYRDFRKFLIKSGFIMMQESIYSRLVQNPTAAELVTESLKKNKPSSGIVQVLKITEKQYSKMEYIVGEGNSTFIDSDERVIVL